MAGRPELLDELQRTESDVREFLKTETARFLSTGLVPDVVAGALPDARIVPGLVQLVMERFLKIRDMQ